MAFTGSNWGRRVLLTGLSPSASLSGFVALVSLANIPVEAIDAGSNSALNGGGDLRFSTDDAGVNQLPLEVVSYVTNATEGNRSCQLWIRFPTYASGTREVYMFYKKAGEVQPAVTASFGRNSVHSDSFVATHMEANPAIDSSGNHTLSAGSGVSLVSDSGALGNANEFDGTTAGKYDITDSGAFDVNNISISVVLEMTTLVSENNRRIFGKQNQYNFILRDGKMYCELWTVGGVKTLTGDTALPLDVVHVALDYDGTNITYYLNGVVDGTSVVNGGNLDSSSNTAFIAGRNSTTEALPAIIYEYNGVGISKSASFYASEYANKSAPATFWTTGTPETPNGGLTISPTGIPSEESVGSHTVTVGAVTISPNGIASQESIGAAVISTGAVVISPTGIASEESIGVAVVTLDNVQTLFPTGVGSEEAIGIATITTGAVTISPTGINSEESIGVATVSVVGAKDIKIDFLDKVVVSENLGSITLYYNGSNYFSI